MKFYILILSLLLFLHPVSGTGDTIFFDAEWEKCEREDAVYYRIVKISVNCDCPYIVRDYYLSGKIQMIGCYRSLDPEIKEGAFQYYHENENLSQESSYVNGKLHGWAFWYDNTGRLREKGEYNEGVAEGENITYYANGKVKAKGAYQNDKKEGKWTYWFENGRKKASGKFKKDSKAGAWKYWHENGQLKCIGKHKNGLASGSWTYWHKNGNKQSEGRFKSGQITGKWYYWYKSGKLNMIGVYRKGKLKGNWTYFDEDGNMLAKQKMGKNRFLITEKPEIDDTTINVFANWNKGDQKNLEIIQKVKTFSKDSVVEEETTHYTIEIRIVEQTNDTYNIQWQYKNFYSKDGLMVSSLLKQSKTDMVRNLFKNLVFECELDNHGRFQKLLNTQKIKKNLHASLDSIFRYQLENGQLNLYQFNYKELEQNFNAMKYNVFTESFIENDLTQEIKIFFNQNGKTFQTGRKIKMLSLVEFLGVKSPSKIFINPLYLDKSKNLLTIELSESVSPLAQFPGNFETENQSSSFKVEETNYFTIDYATGWVQSLVRKNVLEVGEMKTIHTLEIR